MQISEYKQWFDFADTINHFALDLIRDHEVARDDNQRVTISVLFVRAHKSFQAAVLLARKGLVADARGVIRRATEGAIALTALANDAEFVKVLIGAHHHEQRKTANVILGDPDYLALNTPEQIAQMKETVQDVNAREAAGEPVKPIKWEQVAGKPGKDLYNTLYRLLSSDGTHTTINALHREMEYDAAQRFAGFKEGPDLMGLVETLKSACLALVWAMDPFIRAFPGEGRTERLEGLLQVFSSLPPDEPPNVRLAPVG